MQGAGAREAHEHNGTPTLPRGALGVTAQSQTVVGHVIQEPSAPSLPLTVLLVVLGEMKPAQPRSKAMSNLVGVGHAWAAPAFARTDGPAPATKCCGSCRSLGYTELTACEQALSSVLLH
eukprot:1157340-Pelagomonas_calceolata.AAC.8